MHLQFRTGAAAPVAVMAVLSIAALLRCATLFGVELSGDELFSWRLTCRTWRDLIDAVAIDGHPPLHFIVLKAAKALFGDSQVGLRALSSVFGLATVPLVGLAVIEASALGVTRVRPPQRTILAGAVIASLLVVINPLQIAGGCTARMYSQGAMLAALSSCLLPRMLLGQAPHPGWAISHGAAIAALCYTHHYGLFTAFAQGMFSIPYLFRARGRSTVVTWAARRAVVTSAAVAVACYAVWLPVLLLQSGRLRAGFWIPPLNLGQTMRVVFVWSAGGPWLGATYASGWFLLAVITSMWFLWRRRAAGTYFLLQAAAPWCFCLVISTFGRRPILLERYMTFAQIAWLAFIGTGLGSLTKRWAQVSVAAVMIAMSAWGAITSWASLRPTHHSMSSSIDWVCAHYRAGDLVLLSGPYFVNLLRYRARTQRTVSRHIDARCRSPFSADDESRVGLPLYAAALSFDEVYFGNENQFSQAHRVWVVEEPGQTDAVVPRGVQPVSQHIILTPNGSSYRISLYLTRDVP